ncbi:Putative glycosyltransferase EpsE [Lacunisphaera limnophila]|uniref:Glycosyltransferase EpsE n=1 Tax=Lacunisphaera limnophila TaxID=1838286 RepID=A0A1D8AUS0_9BACT|nr:glycosyltransferase [Lacunisphaera limnophila]AOS44596.1 Putative glycosyltransferase EpsE [Lacunisphaera limnophila]
MPVVSVLLPYHRVTPFLRPAVESILGQTLRDLELILVDNGTGGGRDVLGEAGRDPRVRLIAFDTNRGGAAALNAARAQARGEYFAHMDSDDIALPTRLERQVAVLRAEPGLGLLSTHALVIDEAGAVTGSQFTLASEREERIFSAYSLPITNPTVMGPRAVFERFPMRGEFLVSADYDFFARVIESHPCRCLPEPLLHYRTHPGQVTLSRRNLMILNACLIRLLTARRRAGRPEDFGALLDAHRAWLAEPPPAAICYGHFAGLALAERFDVLAIFLARRRVAAERRWSVLGAATGMLCRALARPAADRARLLRMFFTGPVRAHGLRPL